MLWDLEGRRSPTAQLLLKQALEQISWSPEEKPLVWIHHTALPKVSVLTFRNPLSVCAPTASTSLRREVRGTPEFSLSRV